MFTHVSLLLFFLAATLISCEKFSGDQTVPAYISIDSITLTTEYSTQGTASHSITDAWIYVDDELVGAFQMPARPPVLKQGSHRVTILTGIKKNGIGTTRAVYDFYNEITAVVNLTPDSTVKLGRRNTTYRSAAEFLWREDFEGLSISLDTTAQSSAWIQKTNSPETTFEGAHSGLIVLDTARDFFEAVNHLENPIPYAPVYLEMNFNIDHPLVVGVFLYGMITLYQTPVITLNPTGGKWKKIYIDLTTSLNAYPNVSTFRVYLGTYLTATSGQAQLLIDNLKLVTRKSS